MKKFGKLAVLAAMVLALACFVSCKNDDDDDSGNNYGNLVATYVCAEPSRTSDGFKFSYTLKFYDSGKFNATYTNTKEAVTGEISKGSYTGDPTKDGNIVFKVEDYVDIFSVFGEKQFKWEKKTIANKTVTVTSGKGKFNIVDMGTEEFTRQE